MKDSKNFKEALADILQLVKKQRSVIASLTNSVMNKFQQVENLMLAINTANNTIYQQNKSIDNMCAILNDKGICLSLGKYEQIDLEKTNIPASLLREQLPLEEAAQVEKEFMDIIVNDYLQEKE